MSHPQIEKWERKKLHLFQKQLVNPVFSPIREESDSDEGPQSPLPDLIIEKIPNPHDEPEEFYQNLEKRMKKLYKKIFLDETSDLDYSFNDNTDREEAGESKNIEEHEAISDIDNEITKDTEANIENQNRDDSQVTADIENQITDDSQATGDIENESSEDTQSDTNVYSHRTITTQAEIHAEDNEKENRSRHFDNGGPNLISRLMSLNESVFGKGVNDEARNVCMSPILIPRMVSFNQSVSWSVSGVTDDPDASAKNIPEINIIEDFSNNNELLESNDDEDNNYNEPSVDSDEDYELEFVDQAKNLFESEAMRRRNVYKEYLSDITEETEPSQSNNEIIENDNVNEQKPTSLIDINTEIRRLTNIEDEYDSIEEMRDRTEAVSHESLCKESSSDDESGVLTPVTKKLSLIPVEDYNINDDENIEEIRDRTEVVSHQLVRKESIYNKESDVFSNITRNIPRILVDDYNTQEEELIDEFRDDTEAVSHQAINEGSSSGDESGFLTPVAKKISYPVDDDNIQDKESIDENIEGIRDYISDESDEIFENDHASFENDSNIQEHTTEVIMKRKSSEVSGAKASFNFENDVSDDEIINIDSSECEVIIDERSFEENGPSAKKIKYENARTQTFNVNWDDIKSNLFVGRPKILRLYQFE